MPYFEHNRASIYYEIWGEGGGPWITLLNGLSRTTTDFKAMARFMNERNWRVLFVDNHGAGQTESPLGFTIDENAHDIVHLWDHLGISGSCVLGISYGGLLAMHVALLAGSRVSRLFLVSTACKSSDVHSSQDINKYFSESFIEGHEIMVSAFVKEMTKAFQDPVRAGKAAAQKKAMDGVNVCGQLSKIQIPTLVLHGDADQIVPISAGKMIQSLIPKAQIEVFEGTGHLLLAETPKRLYERVWEFCVRDPE